MSRVVPYHLFTADSVDFYLFLVIIFHWHIKGPETALYPSSILEIRHDPKIDFRV